MWFFENHIFRKKNFKMEFFSENAIFRKSHFLKKHFFKMKFFFPENVNFENHIFRKKNFISRSGAIFPGLVIFLPNLMFFNGFLSFSLVFYWFWWKNHQTWEKCTRSWNNFFCFSENVIFEKSYFREKQFFILIFFFRKMWFFENHIFGKKKISSWKIWKKNFRVTLEGDIIYKMRPQEIALGMINLNADILRSMSKDVLLDMV